jgi:hypothetical protein
MASCIARGLNHSTLSALLSSGNGGMNTPKRDRPLRIPPPPLPVSKFDQLCANCIYRPVTKQEIPLIYRRGAFSYEPIKTHYQRSFVPLCQAARRFLEFSENTKEHKITGMDFLDKNVIFLIEETSRLGIKYGHSFQALKEILRSLSRIYNQPGEELSSEQKRGELSRNLSSLQDLLQKSDFLLNHHNETSLQDNGLTYDYQIIKILRVDLLKITDTMRKLKAAKSHSEIRAIPLPYICKEGSLVFKKELATNWEVECEEIGKLYKKYSQFLDTHHIYLTKFITALHTLKGELEELIAARQKELSILARHDP